MNIRHLFLLVSLGWFGAAVAGTAGSTSQIPATRTAICDSVRLYLTGPASRHVRLIADTLVPSPVGPDSTWPRRGCGVSVVDTLDARPGPGDLEHWFIDRGWSYARYAADGPDGTMWGVVRGRDLCIVEGAWDGGDDADSTYVPKPGFTLDVQCLPAAPSDTAGT